MALPDYEQCIEIIKLMDLHDFYPKKITRENALKISDTISRKDLKERRQIPWFMLHNLLTCNYEGMTLVLNEQRSVAESGGEPMSLSCFLRDSKSITKRDQEHQVHPLDVLVSLFLCSDDFLRQILVEKLSTCQLGIPLLLPVIDAIPQTSRTEMLVWATSTLKKQWKDRSGTSFEHSMAVHPLPIVTAIRLGRPRISKSKILNRIISKHDIFFHYKCKGCGVKKVISNGLLQMSWYLPMGNDGDNFPAAFGIMNLRGDAYDLDIQNNFLMKASSTTIVFCKHDISKEKMSLITSWNDQNCHLILVFDEKPIPEWTPIFQSVIEKTTKGKMVQILVKDDNTDLVQMLRDFIKKYMLVNFTGKITSKSLENCEEIASEAGIRIDDKDTGVNFKTKLKASELLKYIESTHTEGGIKDMHLPLQKITYKIATKKREWLNMKLKGEMPIEEYVQNMELQIKDLRKEQLSIWENPSEMTMVKKFIDSFAFSSVGRSYFFYWMSTMLDRYSIQHLQRIRNDYYDTWKGQCASSKNQTSATAGLKTYQCQLHQSSLRLENLNREVAQVYEMASDLPEMCTGTHIQQFPNIAAEMLIDGQPLEIMDGDATYVPVTWLKEVFTCLKRKVGNVKIFVLSILGIQSSGKSTLLNTMFGLKFPVSAGRCTKGAFAQLVSIEEEFENKCKYILVIDTEGLRAPEFASIEHSNHDNEMATFLIGLGDATIINVMGENQTDIQDILQTVVHALMKMNSVNLKPSCLFVHHNVSDVSAAEKCTAQKITLRTLLDQTTQMSAEVQRQTVISFADVINFEEEKHIVYISNLWQGQPPMAPPNPEYVRCVLELKKVIFTVMQEVNGITLHDFKSRLSDLWKAVLCEDFVFSFKNTLEIQAYTALETEYLRVSRQFRQTCMTNCSDLVNKCRKIPVEHMEIESSKIFEEHENMLKIAYGSCFEQMAAYLKKNARASHWEVDITRKMSILNSEMKNTLEEEFEIAKQTVTWKSKIDGDMMNYEKKIYNKARELAIKFRDSYKSKEELELVFNETWQSWINELPTLTNLIDIERRLQTILIDTFAADKQVIGELLQNIRSMHKAKITPDDINKSGTLGKLKMITTDSDLEKALTVISEARKNSKTLIDKYTTAGSNCNENVLQETVEVVRKKLKIPNSTKGISFSRKGVAKHTCYILWKLLPEFKALQKAFIMQNDIREYMSSHRQGYWKYFQDVCARVQTTIPFLFPLKNAVGKAIEPRLVKSVINYLTSDDHKHTFGHKKSFHAKMLIDLAENKSFEVATGYLANPFFHMSRWLQEYIINALKLQTYNKRTVLQNLYEDCVDDKYEEAKTVVKTSCQNIEPTCQLEKLWKRIVDNFKLHSMSVASNLPDKNSKIKVEEFLQNLTTELTTEQENMKKRCITESEDVFLKEVVGPVVSFFEKDLIGCEEVCPFCSAPCDNLSGCTKHRTECHRPQGFGGQCWDESLKLVADLCTTVVSCSDKKFKHSSVKDQWYSYKKYRKVNKRYKSWEINPILEGGKQLYWKWFMAKYNKELADFYGSVEADIPESWKKIEWDSAKQDLITLYNLEILDTE